jgi:hypothetical protein
MKAFRVQADFQLPDDNMARADMIGELARAWALFLDEAAAAQTRYNGAAEPEPAPERPMRVSGGIGQGMGQSQALAEAMEKIRRNVTDKLVRRAEKPRRRRGRPVGSRNKPKPAEAAPTQA